LLINIILKELSLLSSSLNLHKICPGIEKIPQPGYLQEVQRFYCSRNHRLYPHSTFKKLSHDCVATPAAKLEMFNPMSVKGRPVLYMIEEAERNGFINKDTTIIEASRGYTGVALTFICSVPFLLIQGRDIFPYKVFFKIGVFKVRYFCLGNLISSS
jgi:hypothetical protein